MECFRLWGNPSLSVLRGDVQRVVIKANVHVQEQQDVKRPLPQKLKFLRLIYKV